MLAALRATTAALFSLLSTYPPQPLSAAGSSAEAAQSKRAVKSGEKGKAGRRKEKVERGESRSQIPAAREGSEEGQGSVLWSVILITLPIVFPAQMKQEILQLNLVICS